MALISRQLLHARPQELGKIKIGGKGKAYQNKSGGQSRQPVKFDHFIVTTRERGGDENFVRDDEIHAKLGADPKVLDGMLMFDTVEENFHSEMAHYKGRSKNGKVSTCNGETLVRLDLGGKSGPCLRAAGKECPCKPYGRLHLQLMASGAMGFHVFRTTSWESTNNIQTALEAIFSTFGTCYHVPVQLKIYPSEDRHDDKVTTSHKVGLVLAMPMGEVVRRVAEAKQYPALTSGAELRQLAAGVREELELRDIEEAEDIATEFYPDLPTREVHAIDTANALHAPDPIEHLPLDHEPSDAEIARLNEIEEDPAPFDERAWSELAEDAAQETAGDKKPAAADRHAQLNAKYFAMLNERGMNSDEDRHAFQKRLHAEGKTSSASITGYTAQDYRSAIAELDQIEVMI